MDMISMYSKVYAIICSVRDRLRFILKHCYMCQSVKMQVEESEKEMTQALDILDGKEIIKEEKKDHSII